MPGLHRRGSPAHRVDTPPLRVDGSPLPRGPGGRAARCCSAGRPPTTAPTPPAGPGPCPVPGAGQAERVVLDEVLPHPQASCGCRRRARAPAPRLLGAARCSPPRCGTTRGCRRGSSTWLVLTRRAGRRARVEEVRGRCRVTVELSRVRLGLDHLLSAQPVVGRASSARSRRQVQRLRARGSSRGRRVAKIRTCTVKGRVARRTSRTGRRRSSTWPAEPPVELALAFRRRVPGRAGPPPARAP